MRRLRRPRAIFVCVLLALGLSAWRWGPWIQDRVLYRRQLYVGWSGARWVVRHSKEERWGSNAGEEVSYQMWQLPSWNLMVRGQFDPVTGETWHESWSSGEQRDHRYESSAPGLREDVTENRPLWRWAHSGPPPEGLRERAESWIAACQEGGMDTPGRAALWMVVD